MNAKEKQLIANAKDTDNLNNSVIQKTRRINEYIRSLPEPLISSKKANNFYNSMLKELSKASTNDEKLLIIGYRPNSYPVFYDTIKELNKVTA